MWSKHDALAWLDSHANFERSRQFERPPSLEGVRAVLQALGVNKDSFEIIHVTGTNGKGTVSHIASELLCAMGRRVGLFTSPHVHILNERIRIDNIAIDDNLLISELLVVKGVIEQLGLELSWFEIVTALGLSTFYAEGVEVAVVEVGIGGTWDSTNVIDGDVSVITSVGHDHLELLGPTLADVTRNKVGIIKAGSVGVVASLDADLMEIVFETQNAGLAIVGRDILVSNLRPALGGWQFDLVTRRSLLDDLFLSLHGRHQIFNAALAISAVEELEARSISQDLVRMVLESVVMAARIEVVYRSPLVIVDGSHNLEAARALGDSICIEFEGVEPIVAVVAMLEGKDTEGYLREIRRFCGTVVVSSTFDVRSVSIQDLSEIATKVGLEVVLSENVPSAVSIAMNLVGDAGAVVVCGSFRTAASAREFLIS